MFDPRSLSDTQARVPVVSCGFSCSFLSRFTSTFRTLPGVLRPLPAASCALGPSCRVPAPPSPFLPREAGPRCPALLHKSGRGRCSAARSLRGE